MLFTKRISCKLFFKKPCNFHIIGHNVVMKKRSKPANGCISMIRNNFLFCVFKYGETSAKPNCQTLIKNTKAPLFRLVYTGDFLSRQLDAIFVALKLQQVSNMFETPVISRRQIALKITPGLHVQFFTLSREHFLHNTLTINMALLRLFKIMTYGITFSRN